MAKRTVFICPTRPNLKIISAKLNYMIEFQNGEFVTDDRKAINAIKKSHGWGRYISIRPEKEPEPEPVDNEVEILEEATITAKLFGR
ncbi:MAG: hypothetical protein JRJ78_13875 [Deltaproteobacteria bacterium]|nr:hypothetical protein [Deltaproteobacteria bacterium]